MSNFCIGDKVILTEKCSSKCSFCPVNFNLTILGASGSYVIVNNPITGNDEYLPISKLIAACDGAPLVTNQVAPPKGGQRLVAVKATSPAEYAKAQVDAYMEQMQEDIAEALSYKPPTAEVPKVSYNDLTCKRLCVDILKGHNTGCPYLRD